MTKTTGYEHVSTETLVALRNGMVEGLAEWAPMTRDERVARYGQLRAQDTVPAVHLITTIIDGFDAELLRRGVEVDPVY